MNTVVKKLKKLLLIVLAVAMLVPSMEGLAATQRQKAMAAYNKWLSGDKLQILQRGTKDYYSARMEKWSTYKSTKSSNASFALAYIDNDNIPELIVCDKADWIYNVLSYKNGKVVRLYTETDVMSIPAKYYKKKCVFMAAGLPGVKMNKYIIKKSGKYMCKFQVDVQGRVEYFINRKSNTNISIAEVRARIKNYTKGISPTKIVYYKNTKSNRSKYLK